MPTSIRDLVLQDIVSSFLAITTANGWQQDVRACARAGEWAGNADEWPVLILEPGEEVVTRHLKGARVHKLPITVRAYLREPDTTERQTLLDRLQRDAIAKVMEDETRGGYAVGTDVTALALEQGEASEPDGAALITLEIEYRTQRGDPAVQQVFY